MQIGRLFIHPHSTPKNTENAGCIGTQLAVDSSQKWWLPAFEGGSIREFGFGDRALPLG